MGELSENEGICRGGVSSYIAADRCVNPMIYAYQTPDIPQYKGWVKVGYTERQTVDERIQQQSGTLRIDLRKAWQEHARYNTEPQDYFRDTAFHQYLCQSGVERKPSSEWFHADAEKIRALLRDFKDRKSAHSADVSDYQLREEQARAVQMTREHFQSGGKKFLWNAKPRFGKTLTAYDLVRQMTWTKVLVVTNRPAISSAWAEDFRRFIEWHNELVFVTDNSGLRIGIKYEDYKRLYLLGKRGGDAKKGFVAFESLQGLKGSSYFGGEYDKLRWMTEVEFDLLIVDEAQEGVDTFKTGIALEEIHRDHTLYLSGTPFKALANAQFSESEIFNWSYADEQEAKRNWDEGNGANPYEGLPQMTMLTYQLSEMMREETQRGAELGENGENAAYTFDLNTFFSTKADKTFVYEDSVQKFLRCLSTNEKYPFSTPELREQLSHTLWILDRVDSVKRLAKLLEADVFFREYRVVVAAGSGKNSDDADIEREFKNALESVKKAVSESPKTITLSVGQLTVGVTVPEWSAVLMLCNLKSPSAYMQAAFRAQNPWIRQSRDGKNVLRKSTSYVFDFDPTRTLMIYDEFANNLSPKTAKGSGTADERKENIRRLLNFFPVVGEDDAGKMVEIDAAQVLSIPRRIKSREVVRRGFMSNFLFQNISNIFGAPQKVEEILGRMPTAKEEKIKAESASVSIPDDMAVDENGKVKISDKIVIGTAQALFGDKVFDTCAIDEGIERLKEIDSLGITSDTVKDHLKQVKATLDGVENALGTVFCEQIVKPISSYVKLPPKEERKLQKEKKAEIAHEIGRIYNACKGKMHAAIATRDEVFKQAADDAEIQRAEANFREQMEATCAAFHAQIEEIKQNIITDKPKEIVEWVEKQNKEAEKQTIEDGVRAHLRGFSRTIPSFIMAYGDENLRLSNFDAYTEENVFKEVTGISLDDFRFLRDGGDYVDDTGVTRHFSGHLFDETVFNDSIQEFLKKRQSLANYFDETLEEDIFDYIPPQKTNQIYTPRKVVECMVNALEENCPGCYDDPSHTFADLYMKSGLYIAEIVKRLYRSQKMKVHYPNDDARIRHILHHQVYGMAPTRIIYLIATNYILGFDEALKKELVQCGTGKTAHFVEADAAKAAKAGKLQALVDENFGS